MKITIEYDSCWQNSFLSEGDNDTKVNNNKRKFIATSKSKDNIKKPIEKSTVLGILCRLIGDQRKLYQAQSSPDYYFKEIEEAVTFINKPVVPETLEQVFIINKSDARCAQSTFLGIIPSDSKWFFSEHAPYFWSVLFLGVEALLDFIVSDEINNHKNVCAPRDLLHRIDQITNPKQEYGKVIKTKAKIISEKKVVIDKLQKKLDDYISKVKSQTSMSGTKKDAFSKKENDMRSQRSGLMDDLIDIHNSGDIQRIDIKLSKVVDKLSTKFPGKEYIKDDVVYPSRLYAAALYLHAERMHSKKMNVDHTIGKNGGIQIQGFSVRGFNGVRDFLNPLAGAKKKTVGTPFSLSKASGQLEINIDVDKDKGREIQQMIDCAGVSSFYLGKKGLAYVSNIDTRPRRN